MYNRQKFLMAALVGLLVQGLSVPATAAPVFAPVCVHEDGPAESSAGVVEATLNGLEIVLDAKTGSVLSLSYPGVGKMLDTTPDAAGIVDLAYPVKEFEPLRLASRFSSGAGITKTEGQVVVHWDRLGTSRPFVDPPGRVSASVTLKAAPDGKSVIVACSLENQSDHAVRQVLFPDFVGLVPPADEAQTEVCIRQLVPRPYMRTQPATESRMGMTFLKPFVSLAKPVHDDFYAKNQTMVEFLAKGKDGSAASPWMGYGSAEGGFGLFSKRRVPDKSPAMILHLSEKNNKLRMMWTHYVNITKGGKWESAEYLLTPFGKDWAEAAEPYRAWISQENKQEYDEHE